MWTNKYGTTVTSWKVDLIVARAKRFGFKRHELEDIQQELIIHVLAFEFDEDRANGATEATALTALIDNKLRQIRRTEQRYDKHVEAVEPRPEVDDSQDVRHQQRVLDVADVLARLSADDQDLCQAMSGGVSIANYAEQIGSYWRCVRDRLDRIGQQFESLAPPTRNPVVCSPTE